MPIDRTTTAGGKSMPMPSVTLSLPMHVNAKPRKDGTHNVLFEVRRNRPLDWPSTIPLPLTGERRGDLNDADEVARIKRDVEGTPEKDFEDGLLWQLEQARKGEGEPGFPKDSLPAIAALWEASWNPDGKKPTIRPRTQDFYRKGLRILDVWSAQTGHKPARHLTLQGIVAFLALYDDRPAQRGALRRTISALFSFALVSGVGGVKAHPLGVTPRLSKRHSKRKRPVHVWGTKDVETYATAALDKLSWPGGARLVRLMWETSADATDVVTWRRDVNFRDTTQPAITYARGKTGEEIVVPISKTLAQDLRTCGEIFFVTDPDGRPYVADNVESDNKRGWHFRVLQAAVVDDGGPRRVLDHLRHSAVTHAVECGAHVPHLPSLTGHREGSKMPEQVYRQLTEAQATAVQRARGIVE